MPKYHYVCHKTNKVKQSAKKEFTLLPALKRRKTLSWLFLSLLLPLEISHACGPTNRSFHGYSFVKMEILPKDEQKGLAPVFLSFDKMYRDYFEAADTLNQNDNLAEWHRIFCGEVEREDLFYIVYKAPVEELDLLLTATQSKSLQVPGSLRGNTFADFVFTKKCDETIEYLMFAKRCEPYVVPTDQWEAPPRDKEAMQRLIGEGSKLFRRTKSHYIRLRYAYQIIRLAHYAGQHEQVLELYDELIPKVDKALGHWDTSIIPWWIEGHKAGALRKMGDNVQASYLYMQVFLHCPGRRASAYQSFFIKNNEEWEACLRLCQSDQERAALYAIRAAAPNSRAVEEMEKIYEIDPVNQFLEVLLVQEMRKMERSLLGLEFNSNKAENKRYHNIPKANAGRYVVDLQKFVRRCRQEGKVVRPVLWHIAEGYLEFLAGDFYAADLTFREAAREVGDKLLKEQLDIFQLALKIAAFEKPSKEVEDFAYELLMEDPRYRTYNSLPDYLRDKMTWLYNEVGQKGKAFLSQHPLKEMKPNPQMELLNDLLATALKPDQSRFERLLMSENPTNELLDMKATLLMSEGQMEAAFETFKRIPAEQWNDYGQFDPFKETFKDCISCYERSDSVTLSSYFNKGELLESLLDLEYKAKGDLDGAATHYYKLGLAYYNISYFGYAWRAMDYFRSGSTWANLHRSNGGVYQHYQYPFGNKENVDLSRALYFFEKARLNATTSELAAKAAYQAARCEQKIYFQTDAYKPEPCCNRIPRLPSEYLVNFSRLKEQYSETEFYKMIIKECKYFAVYAGK
jgi:hypothetical protein